jgi:hypothetical protein
MNVTKQARPFRLGWVGPGRWGQLVASVFRAFEAEVLFHVRSPMSTERAPGMGYLVSLQDLLFEANAKMVDAIVCTAPPEETLSFYETCKTLAIPTMLTKPLKLSSIGDLPPLVPTVVDYVRLWSPQYHKIKQESQKAKIKRISIEFYGRGPYRSYPGLWDYGPHAVAFLFDLLGDQAYSISSVQKTERDGGDYRFIEGTFGEASFEMSVGNGSEEAESKKLTVKTEEGGEYVYEEVGGVVHCKLPRRRIVDDRPQALQLFVKSFIEDVKSNKVNLYTLWLSTRICEFLKQVESHDEWSKKIDSFLEGKAP